MILNVLSIAGSDPSGGAGIQADLKTFDALGCYGMAAITALTAQNTQGVFGIMLVPPEFVVAQVEAILTDIRVDAIKIGMVGSAASAEAIAAALVARRDMPVVLDPVLVATSGHSLGGGDVARALRSTLAPCATLLTPNLAEAAALSGLPIARSEAEMIATGKALLAFGSDAVLVKGGHLEGDDALDILCTANGVARFATPRIRTRNTHGTGCTLSSAIAAALAQGRPLQDAIREAKNYLQGALSSADALIVGSGPGPVHHFHALRAR